MLTEHFKTSTFHVFPTDLNGGNTLFGGKLMAEMDCEMAKVAESVIWNTGADNVVTASISEINFLRPAYQNDLIVMETDVYEMGRSSMKIWIACYIWDGPNRNNWKMICNAKSVFVALKDKKPFPHGQKLE
jgi:acyl-CoA hydrolase